MTSTHAAQSATLARPLHSDLLSHSLGVASAALGVPQLLRPADFADAIGVEHAPRRRTVTRAIGVRELVAAGGLLSRPRPVWLWARVAGDAMDIGLMARALRHQDRDALRRGAITAAGLILITAVDVYAAVSRTIRKETGAPMELRSTTTINRPAEEVYAFWRQFDRLPTFMAHLEEVRVMEGGRSHWRASAPFGREVEWDAEMTDDIPGERIAWRSLDSADVPNSGEVRFVPAPGGRGTEVHVTLTYEMPGGALGKAVAKYFGEEPGQQLDDDLRRFKQVMETGEVIRSDGAPRGKQAREEFPQHPAQPLSEKERTEVMA